MNQIYTLRSRPGTEHGRYEAACFGQTLVFSARGPWNDETLRRGSKEVGEIINSFDHSQPWCQISCLYGESLMQPSVFEYFVKQTKIRRQLGLSVLAIVIKDSDIESTIRRQLSNAYALTNVEFEFFSSINSAIQMLEASGFILEQNNVRRFFILNDYSSLN